MTEPRPKRSVAHVLVSMIAITAGVMALVQGGMRGRAAGWEEMAIYAAPAVLLAIVSIAMRRSGLSYAAVVFGGVLGVVGFLLGS